MLWFAHGCIVSGPRFSPPHLHSKTVRPHVQAPWWRRLSVENAARPNSPKFGRAEIFPNLSHPVAGNLFFPPDFVWLCYCLY